MISLQYPSRLAGLKLKSTTKVVGRVETRVAKETSKICCFDRFKIESRLKFIKRQGLKQKILYANIDYNYVYNYVTKLNKLMLFICSK